jgi:serine/threonine-protein kinase
MSAAVLLVPRLASAGDPTLAEALFREGRALMKSGDLARACPKLAESYRQDAATGTLLALAMCHEQAGKLASAWTAYNAVIARAQREGQSDREKAAQRRVLALEPRLSALTLEVPADLAGLPGLEVLRDGEPVPPAAWGTPVPVDPGEHTVEAKADGRSSFRRMLVFGPEADKKTLRVELSAAVVVAQAERRVTANPRPVATAAGSPRSDTRQSSPTPVQTVGFAVGLTGLTALAGGVVFGVRALNLDADAREVGRCDETAGCDPAGLRLNEQSKDAARLANILYVTGGVLVAGGVALYVLGAPKSPSVSLHVTPTFAGLAPGLRVRAGF